MRRHAPVGDVRGVGLAVGVGRPRPDDTAAAVKEGMRERGVLVGTTGRHGNVLKVRPPLAFSDADIPVFADALAATLASNAAR